MVLNMFNFRFRFVIGNTQVLLFRFFLFSSHGEVGSGIPFGSVNLALGVSDDESQARRASPRATLLSLGCAS